MKIFAALLAVACLLPGWALGQGGSSGTFVNFEGSQTNPVRLSPDGTRLFAVNTAAASLCVFDVTTPANPC